MGCACPPLIKKISTGGLDESGGWKFSPNVTSRSTALFLTRQRRSRTLSSEIYNLDIFECYYCTGTKTLPRHQVPGKFMIRWWSNFWLMFQFWNTKFVRFQIYRPKLIPILIQDLSWQSGIGHQIALYLLSIKISRSMLRWVLSGALSDPKNLLLTLSVTALAKKWRQKYLWGHN